MEAIRNKYRGVKFMKVADLPELKGEVGLKFLLHIFTNFSCSGSGTTCSKETIN